MNNLRVALYQNDVTNTLVFRFAVEGILPESVPGCTHIGYASLVDSLINYHPRPKKKIPVYQWMYKKQGDDRLHLSTQLYRDFFEAKVQIFGSLDASGIYLSRVDESEKEIEI